MDEGAIGAVCHRKHQEAGCGIFGIVNLPCNIITTWDFWGQKYMGGNNLADFNMDTAVRLHTALLPLTEPLHEAFALAVIDAQTYIPPYKNAGRMAHLRSGVIRAGVREHLTNAPAASWSLGGNPELMGQISLVHKEEGITMRLLKSAKQTAGVPHAGSNLTRRAYWRNTPMLEFETGTLFPDPGFHRLLALWTPQNDGTVSLRVVRPIKEGRYGGTVEVDFAMELAPNRSDFEQLEFVGEPAHEEDLFNPQVAEDEISGEEGV